MSTTVPPTKTTNDEDPQTRSAPPTTSRDAEADDDRIQLMSWDLALVPE